MLKIIGTVCLSVLVALSTGCESNSLDGLFKQQIRVMNDLGDAHERNASKDEIYRIGIRLIGLQERMSQSQASKEEIMTVLYDNGAELQKAKDRLQRIEENQAKKGGKR